MSAPCETGHLPRSRAPMPGPRAGRRAPARLARGWAADRAPRCVGTPPTRVLVDLEPTPGSRRSRMNRNATHQHLRSHLAYLKPSAAAEQLPAALETAEREKPGTTQFLLHDLLDVEVTATFHRREGQSAPRRPARGREDNARDRPGHQARPAGYRVYSPPPPFASRAPPRPRSTGAGRPPRGSGTALTMLVIDGLGDPPMPGEAASHLFQVISRRHACAAAASTAPISAEFPSFVRDYDVIIDVPAAEMSGALGGPTPTRAFRTSRTPNVRDAGARCSITRCTR